MLKIKQGFVLKKILESYIVVPIQSLAVNFKGIIKLNETGVFLWNMLVEGSNLLDLSQALTAHFPIENDVAKEDVVEFVNKLEKANLLD